MIVRCLKSSKHLQTHTLKYIFYKKGGIMPVQHSVLISGTSSGLGLELAKDYLNSGSQVWGLSRNLSEELSHYNDYHHISCDFENEITLETHLKEQQFPSMFNLVILNAGQLGTIQRLVDSEQEELKRLMQVHVWSHQILLKYLFLKEIVIHQIIGISSGASVNGSAGWSGYSISKAAFNMWIQLFSHDYPTTHFTALAPGLIDTQMQEQLQNNPNEAFFPSITKLKESKAQGLVWTPQELAPRLIQSFPKLLEFPSGSYQDIRKI